MRLVERDNRLHVQIISDAKQQRRWRRHFDEDRKAVTPFVVENARPISICVLEGLLEFRRLEYSSEYCNAWSTGDLRSREVRTYFA